MNGASRWANFYLESVQWLLRETGIDGIYLDGIRHSRVVTQRLRRIFDGVQTGQSPGRQSNLSARPLLDLHAGPNLRSFLEHLPYVDSLWVGENIAWASAAGPDYWLVAVSGASESEDGRGYSSTACDYGRSVCAETLVVG